MSLEGTTGTSSTTITPSGHKSSKNIVLTSAKIGLAKNMFPPVQILPGLCGNLNLRIIISRVSRK
jgi:hypothetical protein